MKAKPIFTLLLIFLLPPYVAADDPVKKPESKKTPEVFDLCQQQTPIRNQGGRDTCPYFPPVAALEAAYKRAGIAVNLSVEHLIWNRNVMSSSDKNSRDVAEDLISTLGGGGGMGVLQQYAVCRAEEMPYRGSIQYPKNSGLEKYDWSKPFSQMALNLWNLDPANLPAAARTDAKYAIEKFDSIPAHDLRNSAKFEEILYSGHEIVFSMNIHANSNDLAAKGQPVWRLKPNTRGDSVNHFMLMVGYDRARKFFVVKNQWGPTNYTAQQGKLAEGWKDIIKYDGFTLVDYNYLATFSEAHYITEVAPVGSRRFIPQRAIGQWEVTFKKEGKKVNSGVLCWRHPPISAEGKQKADLRLGELVLANGEQYRVNGKLDGDGSKPYQISLHVDFSKGTLPLDSTAGATWKGTLHLPDNGKATMHLKPHGGAKEKVGDGDTNELEIDAKLVLDQNLLREIGEHK
ncbi:hypothetical protein KIH39_14795 [Telmatocola sphagniphila]|uniref:Peptidase C1A papain C-terminal domain-containing protein n=1 Tax=Telmatocola sphagniphila TaxID=1123043 RepID=A0A8E6B3Y9_9BACT|nr:C1 family peptidase [Telmatocola sphagniphila]QVL30123.1 hypothetical protein KIH39_14795 [Telmatocola sphagniphila]